MASPRSGVRLLTRSWSSRRRHRQRRTTPVLGRSARRGPGNRPTVLCSFFAVARARKHEGEDHQRPADHISLLRQALEGEETAVRALFDRISADVRHTGIKLIDEGNCDQRTSMAWVSASDGPTFPAQQELRNLRSGPRVAHAEANRSAEADAQHDWRGRGLSSAARDWADPAATTGLPSSGGRSRGRPGTGRRRPGRLARRYVSPCPNPSIAPPDLDRRTAHGGGSC
ncbi:BLUF domain-containing protein [Pseudonocardia saturnea]